MTHCLRLPPIPAKRVQQMKSERATRLRLADRPSREGPSTEGCGSLPSPLCPIPGVATHGETLIPRTRDSCDEAATGDQTPLKLESWGGSYAAGTRPQQGRGLDPGPRPVRLVIGAAGPRLGRGFLVRVPNGVGRVGGPSWLGRGRARIPSAAATGGALPGLVRGTVHPGFRECESHKVPICGRRFCKASIDFQRPWVPSPAAAATGGGGASGRSHRLLVDDSRLPDARLATTWNELSVTGSCTKPPGTRRGAPAGWAACVRS
jgi:hypothetical protein